LRTGCAGNQKPSRGPWQYEEWFHVRLLASDTHCLSPLPGVVPVCSRLDSAVVDVTALTDHSNHPYKSIAQQSARNA
jgi:hypothetical protein